MNSKQAVFFTFLFFLFPLILFAQFTTPDSSKMVTLHINPSNAQGALVSDVFSEVEFIPLKTTKESLFGSVDNLHVIKGLFIFTDIDTPAVYIFDSTGKFRAKIDKSTTKLTGIDVDRDTFYNFEIVDVAGQKAIQPRQGKSIFTINIDGKLLEKSTNLNYGISDFREYKFNSQKDYVEFDVVNISNKDTSAYEFATFKDNKKTGQYFPIDLRDSASYTFVHTNTGIFDYGVDNSLFFLRVQDYDVYLATPEKLSIAYRFVFSSAKTLPKNFRTSEKYRNNAIQWVNDNDQVIYGIGNTFLLKDKLFFKAESMAGKNSLLYNFKNESLISLDDLQPDSISQFLPISDSGVGNDFRSKGLQTFKDGNFYTSYSALAFSKIMKQAAGKNLKFDARLTKFLKEGTMKDNPIIVRLKPKSN